MLSRLSMVRLLSILLFALVSGLFFGCGGSRGEPTVRDIDPKVGHTQGEQPVRILGDNFRQDIGYSVYFGTRKAGNVTILGPNALLVTTPPRVPIGAVDVLIQTDTGITFKLPKAFEFKDMGGNVIGGIGESVEAKKEEKGNLAF
ncbi:MAG: IPT/TIG domain-containing protein [Deltaproteobacteria bacterium]|nr:IPT/TIG domain-containing protein [Deltaproteobacteria bacterium]